MDIEFGTHNPEGKINGSIFGKKPEPEELFPKNSVFRIFTGCVNDDDNRAMVEHLFTQSYRCQGYLKKPGDLTILDYTGTFNKNGEYCMYVRYVEMPACSK